jgi:uncharacterized protein involved in type VI secretion and phage assembly
VAWRVPGSTRRYCCRYRESDLDFVKRLFTEERLGLDFKELENGYVVLLFDDVGEKDLTPDDASSAFGGSTCFDGARRRSARQRVIAARTAQPARGPVHCAQLRLQGQESRGRQRTDRGRRGRAQRAAAGKL